MKIFQCQRCQNLLYFENTSYEHCGSHLGYIADKEALSAVRPNGTEWNALADPSGRYRFCANWELRACNWLVRADLGQTYCECCTHNRTIADITEPTRHAMWLKLEVAKRRLFYSLIKLRLPLPQPGSGDPEPLVFDFLIEAIPDHKILTGHDNGVITISLQEADDAYREKMRTNMHEPYRTLLGHFRHEVGHFYWDRLVRDRDQLAAARAVFGDERKCYNDAKSEYYCSGPIQNWQESHVSAYATMHPWEDFAETWAHYLHIVDTLEMAYAFGLRVAPRIAAAQELYISVDRNPYRIGSMREILADWLPMTFAVNSLNRTMGQPDLYPFVISPAAEAKLAFVHSLIASSHD